ncbi:MAG TPA: HAMP domain-containing sensor histidine kinase [Pirellulaceae bacterium]|nr:HAMP domain-containing sensor histidine kinase [Pirellulaceae bacterium]
MNSRAPNDVPSDDPERGEDVETSSRRATASPKAEPPTNASLAPGATVTAAPISATPAVDLDDAAEFAAALQHEKLAALKQFAYGASHELNNPLANIATRAQALLRGETDPERRRALAVIAAQAFRAHDMISDLMLFAHPPAPRRRRCDLSEIAARVCGELRDEADERRAHLELQNAAEPIELHADPDQLAVALKAIVLNALQAVAADGRVEVEIETESQAESETISETASETVSDGGTRPAAGADGRRVRIHVRDDGPGLEPHVRRHLFDPFFSGREAGRGLGFGLCKAWRIAELHGGRIDVDSELGEGSVFTIDLPRGDL